MIVLHGLLSPGQLQPELSAALEKTEPGRSTKPVRGARGVHVLYVERKTDARQILFARRYEAERKKWIQELRRKATIQTVKLTED